jgi:hypothetical protein
MFYYKGFLLFGQGKSVFISRGLNWLTFSGIRAAFFSLLWQQYAPAAEHSAAGAELIIVD